MSVLADALGKKEDASHFADVASSYLPQFLDLAISSDQTHITLAYHNETSWSTQYNLFGDVLLGLELLPQEVYQMQEDFYHTVMGELSCPLSWELVDERQPHSVYLLIRVALLARPIGQSLQQLA